MKFICDKCSSQYLISDDKITGRGVKVRCKRCGNFIILHPEGSAEEAPVAPATLPKVQNPQSDDDVGQAFDQLLHNGDEDEDEENEGQSTVLFDASNIQRTQRDEAAGSDRLKAEDRIDEVFRAAESTSTRPTPGVDAEQKDWFVAIGDRQNGPMTLAELLAVFRAGEINLRSLAWRPGMSNWTAIGEISTLVGQLGQSVVEQGSPKIEKTSAPAKDDWDSYRGSGLTDLVDEEMAQKKTGSAGKEASDADARPSAAGGLNLWDGESGVDGDGKGRSGDPLKDAADAPPWEQSSADSVAQAGPNFFDSSLDPVATGEGKYFSSSGSRSRVLAGPAYLGAGRKRGSRLFFLAVVFSLCGAAAVIGVTKFFPGKGLEVSMVSPPVAGLQPQPVANPKPPETMIAPAPVTPTLAPTDSEPEPKEDRLDQPKAPARTAMLEKSQERLPPKERPKPTPVAAKEGMERKREMPSERPAPAADTTDSGMPRQVSREQIQQTMQKHIKAMKLCVEQQVQRDPNVTGTMHVQFTIAPSGGVSEVTIKTAEHSDSFVAGCIAYIIKSMKFPQAREPFIVPDLPLRLGE